MFSIEKYRDILLQSGYEEALNNPYHFWKILTDKTAFVINLKKLEKGVGIVYGVCSTAVFWSDADWDFHREYGTNDEACNLRYYLEITTIDEERVAEVEIHRLYEKYCTIDKDTLMNTVKDLRKQFIQEITNILKPLGFRKKGNKWSKHLSENIVLQFWADKNPYADLYYFEVDIFSLKSSKRFWCYSKRLDAIGTDIFDWKRSPESERQFDWQLQSIDDLRSVVNRSYEKELLPLINTELVELGMQPFVWNRCICPRDCCETCWVHKNLWEAKEL